MKPSFVVGGDLYLLTVDFCLSPDTLSAFYFPPFLDLFFDLNTLLLFWLFMLWGHPSFRLSHDKLVSQLQNVKKVINQKAYKYYFSIFFFLFFFKNTGIEWFESLNNIYWNVCTSGWAANIWMWTWWCGVPLMWDGGCKLFPPPAPHSSHFPSISVLTQL